MTDQQMYEYLLELADSYAYLGSGGYMDNLLMIAERFRQLSTIDGSDQ